MAARCFAWIVLLSAALAAAPAVARDIRSDDAIRRQIIADSIASYPGNCPCPYNTMRNGANCGRRSAYSKPGGRAPLCYPENVTEAMVARYRARN